MPKIDKSLYDAAATASESAAGHNIDPGCYVCAIQAIELIDEPWCENEPSFDLVYDVAEGDKAGIFSDNWSLEHPWAHRITINYAIDPDNAYSSLKNFKSLAKAVDESNPGTDFLAAFEADNFTLLVGKQFALLVDGEERTSDSGYLNVNASRFHYGIYPVEMVRNGGIKRKPKVKLENAGSWETSPTWGEYQTRYSRIDSSHNDSIPF